MSSGRWINLDRFAGNVVMLGLSLAGLSALEMPNWAAPKIWSPQVGDTRWSAAANWNSPGIPGPNDNVTFTNLAAADFPLNAGGVLNSTVDADFAAIINSLAFRNIEGAHNVSLVNPLVVRGSSAGDVAFIADDNQPAILFVGSGKADSAGDVVYTTITGAALTVSNINANLSVMQGSETSGAHWATLDLSGLNSFTCNLLNILVAHDFGVPVMRPNGTLILAVSNSITAKMISVADAYQNAGSGGAGSRLYFGQANQVNVDRIRVALHKCVGTVSFAEGLSGAIAIFRGADGTSRQISWEIGDEYEPDTTLGYFTSSQAIGVMDFNGGIVDAMVDRITLGRGQTNAPTRTGDGNGTLSFSGGTINVNTLEVGVQLTGGASAGRGILNVSTDFGTFGTLTVNSNLIMAVQLPGNTDAIGSTAEINLNGAVLA
jgi:hypothetical protein